MWRDLIGKETPAQARTRLWKKDRDFAFELGARAKSHVWYPIEILRGFLPFYSDSVERTRLFVRFPDGHIGYWDIFSNIKGATEWCVRREGWFEI